MGKPNCRQCKHFFITFDPKAPYGCRKFQFKGAQIPSQSVAQVGAGECQAYEAKPSAQGQKASSGFNDPKYW